MSTIAAIATPNAPGGISVIRISGENSLRIADMIFKNFSGVLPSDMQGYTCAYGNIVHNNEIVDDVVLTVFRNPKSYTGEDVVEISCHGGRYITKKILRIIYNCGAVPAQAGEFTKRAFLNGKMSLTQAEAVMDVISSAGERQLRYANALKDGATFRRINSIKERLVNILADLAAWADFPEEDVPEVRPEVLAAQIDRVVNDLTKTSETYDHGRIVREGINTVIAGRPNVGKSTLFNAITNAGAESANYPFCTIEPNVGMVAVPDERLDKLAEMYHPKKKTPAVIEFVDIAGLVKGASQGAGLGNKFLENIRRTDAIVHVVRCFDDENIMHVVADASTNVPVDPLGDIETIDLELIMADLEMVNRRVEKATKMAKGDKKFLHEVELFSALAKHLDAGKSARTFEVSSDDAELIATADLLSLKPIIYAANMDEDGFANQDGNQYLQQVKELADREGAQVLPICAKLEQDIAELDGEDRAMFLEELGIQESGLDRLIKCSYALLGLISFLTYGEDECRAWTIKNGTKAPQAAGKIHSDIERGFIRAETINFDDMIRCGSVAAAKEKGLLRSEGKEYVVKDGDMIYFRFNV